MIKTCQHCGAVNGDPSETCCFCDAPLNPVRRTPASRRAATPTEGSLAVEPEWRREVSSRLHAYRVRRHGSAASEIQETLPFELESAAPVQRPDPHVETEDKFTLSTPSAPQRKSRSERYEISIHEISLPRGGLPQQGETRLFDGWGSDTVLPVASLSERRRSALLDAALLLFSYGGMIALFITLGGHLGFNKLDAIVMGTTLILFYAQYFALFTIFGGSTPGMMLRGIRVVSFDGSIPTSRQMAWRSFGYLISAGTFFLGFFWALWDDDHLCWHDRMSQTYLSPIERFINTEPRLEDPRQNDNGR